MRYQLRYTPKCGEYNARIAPASSKNANDAAGGGHEDAEVRQASVRPQAYRDSVDADHRSVVRRFS